MSDADFRPPKARLNIPMQASVPVLVTGALIAGFIFFWFFCRIEPGTGPDNSFFNLAT